MSRRARVRVLFMPVPRQGNPYQHELASGLAANGVDVRMARGYLQPMPFLWAWLRHRPDVFHLHWTQPYLYWPGRSAPSRLLAWRLLFQLRLMRRLGVRVVWTVHNVAAHERADAGPELRISRRIAAVADALIVHCEAARAEVIQALKLPPAQAAKLLIVPHGHYIDAYPATVDRTAARRALGFGETHKVFLLLGALRGYKGTTDLLDTFKALADSHARLLIAGKPFTPALAAEIAQKAAADSRVVTRLEFIPDTDIGALMLAADCAVLPFRDILTSGSLILAMSFGLAAVAPAMGCLPETVAPHGAILYDASAAGGLAGALLEAMTADLATMGAANRAHIENFSWELVAKETLKRAYLATEMG